MRLIWLDWRRPEECAGWWLKNHYEPTASLAYIVRKKFRGSRYLAGST
jgi:hypothetical protein